MTRTTGPTPHGRRALVAVCSLAVAALAAPDAHARFGDFDPSFGGLGVVTPSVGATGPGGSRFEAVATRPDGRPVAAGLAANGNGIAEGVVVQLTTAGAADPGFGAGGVTRFASAGGATRLHGIAFDASGRVLVAGDQTIEGQPTPSAWRLSATGVLEPPNQFPGAIETLPGEARAIQPGPGGTVLVAGWREVDVGTEAFFMARLTSAGQPDPGFGDGGFAEPPPLPAIAHAEAMAVDAEGRIVVAGWAAATPTTPRQPVLVRYLPGGDLDGGFGTRGVVLPLGTGTGELRAVRIDAPGRIVAAGSAGTQAFVTRRLATGAPDGTFGSGGSTFAAVGAIAALYGLAVVGDRPFVAGDVVPAAAPRGMLLGALAPNGTADAGFGGAPPGWRTAAIFGTETAALAVAPGPAGTLYAAGQLSNPPQPFVARTLPNAAPVAVLTAPAAATTGATVTFDASGSSDPEGEPLRYAFDLDGNGSFELDRGPSPVATGSFAAPGVRTVRVRVADPRGAAAVATRSIAIEPPAPPRPVRGEQGVARPLRGIVRVRLPGTRRFVRMRELTAIPNGTEIDARRGRVLITVVRNARGKLDSARFYAGRFIFRQGKGKRPRTNLKLSGGSFAGCRAAASAARLAAASRAAGKRRKRVRRLWGDGRGRFRTRGRYGSGTVRGTKWLTQDRCDGTLVRVVRGRVLVKRVGAADRRGVPPAPPRLVRAGQRVLVRARVAG